MEGMGWMAVRVGSNALRPHEDEMERMDEMRWMDQLRITHGKGLE